MERTCSIDGCLKMATVRGWCPMHYQRWRNNGDPLLRSAGPRKRKPRKVGVEPCSVDGCEKPQKGRTWCAMHYSRWQRLGDPSGRLRGEILDGCKICPGCGKDKPLSDFGARADGRCRACNAADMRERRQEHPQRRRPKRELACRACGEPFLGDKRQSAYCSNECREAHRNRANWKHVVARRTRIRQAFVEAFDRAEIFERDGWVCGICHQTIDPALEWPHPMSATLDHIVPLAHGGEHSRANAQASHNICNIRKADKIA